MRRGRSLAALLLLTTALGCGQRGSRGVAEKLTTYDVAKPDPKAVSGPQIAYSYTLAYRLRSAEIAGVQARQIAACRSLGQQRCLVLKSSTAGGEDGDTHGDASLVIDARLATAFNHRLDAIATEADGTVSDRSVTAEDVTKQVIDTDASVRAKEALAARLLALIQTARGNVGELVAAEKAYADTQQELDAARGLQAELRRRVAMSQIDISYSGREATGSFAPVRASFASAGSTFGTSVGALVTAGVALFPWILLLLALRWIARRLGWRGPISRFRDWRARQAYPAD